MPQRSALRWGTVVAVLIASASLVTPALWGELLTSLWVVPVVLMLGAVGLFRVGASEAAERQLLGRQAAVVALGRTALRPEVTTSLEEQAAVVLAEELGARKVVLRRSSGGEPEDPGRRAVGLSRSAQEELRVEFDRRHPLDSSEREFVDSVLQVVAASLDRLAAEDELRRASLVDALTGLPNRTLLQDRLERGLARMQREGRRLGVLFCGVDDFRRLNDEHGHDAGDLLLRAVAGRLQSAARSADTVARFGGDQFVLVCEVADPQDLLEVADRVRGAVRAVEVPGIRAGTTSVSVGIATSTPSSSAAALLRDADTAMHRAKERGTGTEVFSEALRTRLLRRGDVEAGLALALAAGGIRTHYQPVFDTAALRLVSAEALVRWDRDGSLLLPGEWIDVAEQSGQIVAVGEQVLDRACRDSPTLGVPVAVNVSPRQLGMPGFVDAVARAVERCGSTALVLEVTESAVIDDVGQARAVLADVRDLGVRVAMDDFGTGYSSLSLLSRLPVDILKIDQSFVRRLDVEEGRAVTATIVGLGQALGHVVVAEGVETQEQLEVLRELGCTCVQGFLTGRPVPLEELVAQHGRARTEPVG